MITSEEIKRRLWNGANDLRGSMDASRYKDYMLGLMFYKFLSDKTLEKYKNILQIGNVPENELVERYFTDYKQYGHQVTDTIQASLSYCILPHHLYQTWVKDINTGNFELQRVIDSLNDFERSISSSKGEDDFKGLFSGSTLDLSDTALGSNLKDRSTNIKSLIMLFADLNMAVLQHGDVLGDAYEYLIGMFAMESGKKAGEFYTPRQVSEVMAQIVAQNANIKSIYDPTVGSGSLLLTLRKHLNADAQENLTYYGQEKNTATFNLTRMNLILHGVKPEKMTIKNGDTLAEDWPEDPQRPNEGVQFDAIVMNPPYSAKNWNKAQLKVSDPRFEIAGVVPPDSKGDFAFLLHGLFHLGQQGTMAIVLPHGVLFRGAAEGEIRKRLLEKNYIDTIIGMPNNLFTNTGIPVVVIILKKNRQIGEPILIIDASKNFVKQGKQNALLEKDIAKIVDTYSHRQNILGYSYLATRDDIVNNNYNLNIPRYVESVDKEIPHDVDAHLFGGIPINNILGLKVLQTTVPEIITNAQKILRPGYVKITTPIDELSRSINQDSRIVSKSSELKKRTDEYIQKYWDLLRNIGNDTNLSEFKAKMHQEIKEILAHFEFVDEYDGYQIISDIWNNCLGRDTELISANNFYEVGRTREPRMIKKGSGKTERLEQDGWNGTLVPTDLIAQRLYKDEIEAIEKYKSTILEIESQLEELIELAKEEDTEEFNALSESIKRTDDDELGGAFEPKAIKAALKEATKNSTEYNLLKKVEKLFSDKSTLTKTIKEDEKFLNEAVYERINVLTDQEIDTLVFEKWFGKTSSDMVKLIEKTLQKEIDVLKELNSRYSDTLSEIDQECKELEMAFEEMMKDLVVVQ